jgi:hypothetical protein
MTLVGDMLMGNSHSHVIAGPDGRYYRVFVNWNALYQFMMRDQNRYAHCAITTVNGNPFAIEVDADEYLCEEAQYVLGL